jgi:hypothetical protein
MILHHEQDITGNSVKRGFSPNDFPGFCDVMKIGSASHFDLRGSPQASRTPTSDEIRRRHPA